MKDLKTLWKNPFINVPVGRENKSQFSTETVRRWKSANPGGLHDVEIAAMEAAITAFEAGKTSAETNVRVVSTKKVEQYITKVADEGRRLHAFLSFTFSATPLVVLEFFPSGKSELSNPGRGDVLGILNRWIERTAVRTAQMGTWPAELAALRTGWLAEYNEQTEEKGGVASGRTVVGDGWSGIATVSYDMVLKLARLNPANADILDVYFDFAPLNIRTNTDNDDLGNAEFVTRNAQEIAEPNVLITVLTLDSVVVRTGLTDSTGRLKMRNLPVGQYSIRAEKAQFVANLPAFIEVLDDEDITIFISMLLG